MPETLSKERPLAIIGDEDAVLGFKSLGFKVYVATDSQELHSTLQEVLRQKSAVCLMQDNLYNLLQEEINSYKDLPVPVFIPFAKSLDTDLLNNIVRDIRIRATGAL